MLDLRRLRMLHALAAHGTVGAVASALHVTGPAVSQQLAALEREAGMRLVRRQGRRLTLTDAGNVLVAHTAVMLDQLAAAEADLLALRTEICGTVRLAAFASATATFVADAWRAVSAGHGDRLALRLTGMEPEDSLPALTRGEIDLAVTHSYDLFPFAVPPTCERYDLITDPVAVAMHETDPVAQDGDAVDLARLSERSWLSVPSDTSCHQMLQRACGAVGFVPRLVAQTDDYGAVLALIAARAGVTLLPTLGAQHLPTGVVLRPLERPINRHIFAITRHQGDRHPAVSVVLDHLRTAALSWDHRVLPAASLLRG
ncbi:MAG TPA: LysR family transcriptional regulator [Kribbella sp.]|nr:LysR family transcriptional regulator [Kribbella sp.]